MRAPWHCHLLRNLVEELDFEAETPVYYHNRHERDEDLKEKGGLELTFPRVGVPVGEAIEAIVFAEFEPYLYCHTVVVARTTKMIFFNLDL